MSFAAKRPTTRTALWRKADFQAPCLCTKKNYSNLDFIHVPCSYTPVFAVFHDGCSSPIQRQYTLRAVETRRVTRTTLWREADLEARVLPRKQMAPDIFVRILRRMEACREKPAQPASGSLSWMTPSETLLRLCLGGFGEICQTTSSPGFYPISRAHFRDRKTLCTTRGLPCCRNRVCHKHACHHFLHNCDGLELDSLRVRERFRAESFVCVPTVHFWSQAWLTAKCGIF